MRGGDFFLRLEVNGSCENAGETALPHTHTHAPHLVPQRAQLAVELLVGLHLLVQFPLQLLLGVLQPLDLLFSLVHLPLGRLQPLSQLREEEEKKRVECAESRFYFFSLIGWLSSQGSD